MSPDARWPLPRGRRAGVLASTACGVVILVVATTLLWPDADGKEDPTGPVAGPSASGAVAPGREPQSESPEATEDPGKEPSSAPLLPDTSPAGTGPLPDTKRVSCPPASSRVGSADELTRALEEAEPGDSIVLEKGTYRGSFVAESSGTARRPIFLCGPTDAVIDGGDVSGGYALHLDGAKHWRLVGFSVSGGQKGVMADGTVGSVIQGLTVSGTGDEAVHLRSHSIDNAILDTTISDTGQRNEEFGEGVYIGSAVSNWCTYTDCEADRSDRNVVDGNTFVDTTSEAIDVKEGTTGGVISNNTFDGSALTGADSWVDVKGNHYLIQGNKGVHAPEDGFQTHEILDGWGDHNVFAGNRADVRGPGHAIAARPPASNEVRCDNTVTRADEGLSNITCS